MRSDRENMRSDREKKKLADAKAVCRAKGRAPAHEGKSIPHSAFRIPHSQARESAPSQPVLRLRMMLIGLCVLVVGIAGPLVLVWKQSYISDVSLRLENRAAEFKALNGEITSLKLEIVRLSVPARIERIAASRGFEYPPSSRMEVLEIEPRGYGGAGIGGFFAYVKRLVLEKRG